MSDMFGETIENKEERKSNPKFRKTEFLKLDGEQVIRIVEGQETKHYIHYVNGAYLKCLGSECPICQSNKKILYEHPEDYREVRGWNPRRDRYYINVLDRTPVKVCGECGTENPEKANLCSECRNALGNPVPMNKVKVLNGSARLFEDLKVMSKGVKDDDDKRVDIRMYDWIFNTRGKGREKVTLIRPDYSPKRSQMIEVPAEDLYDVGSAVITLEPEEMLEVFKGTSIKDIFTARRAKNSDSDFFSPTEREKELAGDRELAEQISEDIGKLGDIFTD